MKRKLPVSEALSFGLVLTFILGWYSPMLLNPNAYLTVGDGDGIKAFYVYASHIKNSVDYNEFMGMNYPYSQTHIFTDGQTVIAILFKFLSQWFPFFNTHSMGIYNVLMLMSYPLCAFMLAAIIKRLNMPLVFTVAASVAITLLSPQYFRLFGHPTLSYVCIVPLMWWLLIKYNESGKKLKWSLAIACNAMFWFAVHPYFIMLWVFFAMAYFVVAWLQQKHKMQYAKQQLPYLFLQTALPLAITRLYVKLYDLHQYRSESPYGFWEYYAEWNSVFIPNHGIHAGWFKQLLFPNGTQSWEGQAYIGFGAVLVVVYSIFKVVRYIAKRKTKLILHPVLPPVLKTAVLAAIPVLWFSMCLPFQLGLHSLVEHTSFLKQFRSLGRFAWVFYYIISVYAVYIIYLLYRNLHFKKIAWAAYTVVVLYFAVHIAEALPYHNEGKSKIHESPNYFNKKYLPGYYKELVSEVEKIRDSYQCFIMLPFYHIGSENYSKEFTPQAIQQSMVLSYWTNMPMLNSSAARSPILEAKNIMQFFSPASFQKEIEKDLPDKKDFLLVYNNEPLTDVELYWYNRAEFLWKSDRFELRKLKYDTVFKNKKSENTANGSNRWQDDIPTEMLGGDLIPIVQYNFDTLKSEQVFNGAGALQGDKKEYTLLLKRGDYKLNSEKEYVVGFWYYNKGELRTQVTCVIEQCDSAGNNCNWDVIWNPGESMIINGDWSYSTKKFKPQTTNGQVAVFLTGDKHSKQNTFIDDFMLAEVKSKGIEKSKEPHVMSEVELKANDERITSIISAIKADNKWMKEVARKAKEKKIPLDSMLMLDAEWVIGQEGNNQAANK